MQVAQHTEIQKEHIQEKTQAQQQCTRLLNTTEREKGLGCTRLLNAVDRELAGSGATLFAAGMHCEVPSVTRERSAGNAVTGAGQDVLTSALT